MADKSITVFTAFSGYDSQCLGLERLKEYSTNFDYELVGWSEIDKSAITAHNALFPKYADRNYGDITKIDWNSVPNFDLFTYSSPCQSISDAGKRDGLKEGSGTKSSLLWECRRCIDIKRPKYLLFENVRALLYDKFIDGFKEWIKELEGFGYRNYYEVLDSWDFGLPQHRERVFMVSIRGDVEGSDTFTFPSPSNDEIYHPHFYEYLDSHENVNPKLFRSEKRLKHWMGMNEDAIQKVMMLPQPSDEYELVPCGVFTSTSDQFNKGPMFDCSRTLKAMCADNGAFYKKDGKFYMRLMSGKESLRLMGLTDDEINRMIHDGKMSDSMARKCAGNSICVPPIFHIFRKMFIDNKIPDKNQQYVLF